MNSYQKLKLESLTKDKRISDLYVVIDTLQTNLRSAVLSIPEDKRRDTTGAPSFKWVMAWKPGDEKK